MQKLVIARDDSGSPSYAINLAGAGDVYTCALDGTNESTLTVPANARIAVFGYASGVDYWVSNAAITIPSANTFSASFVYLNPPPLTVTPAQTLHFKSSAAGKISVAFYGQ
jgi:hypothetical protein